MAPITGQRILAAAPNSMPYPDFLQAIKDKRIRSVELIAPNGDEAYAMVSDEGAAQCDWVRKIEASQQNSTTQLGHNISNTTRPQNIAAILKSKLRSGQALCRV